MGESSSQEGSPETHPLESRPPCMADKVTSAIYKKIYIYILPKGR